MNEVIFEVILYIKDNAKTLSWSIILERIMQDCFDSPPPVLFCLGFFANDLFYIVNFLC